MRQLYEGLISSQHDSLSSLLYSDIVFGTLSSIDKNMWDTDNLSHSLKIKMTFMKKEQRE